MASSSKPKRRHDAFLSFRGEDVRNNFLGHLYSALSLRGIHTYKDDKELDKGDQISSSLIKAIQDSRMAIIVFSEDYASSSWCLDEAAEIMDCKEERGLTVFPVFYKVEPREVRTPRQKYREALIKHESKLGENSERVKGWKKALFNAGNLSGWDFKDEDESEFIQKIVKEIVTHLDRTHLHVAKHPVGIDSQVVRLKSMLNLESGDDSVLMAGLWGQGGIGKTTLAKAVYNDIFRQFEAWCFLANVRETSKDCKDLVTLQTKLLSEMLIRSRESVVSSVDAGTSIMQERLWNKKVLLVLDDVDELRQLEALAGGAEWFGNGSRIIFTTRDKHLLTVHGIYEHHVYEVKALDGSEARELFIKHAFSTHGKLIIREDLVDAVLNYAGGLPLALVVLGSFLCGRYEKEWESALKKLSRIPDRSINDVLKISYEGLEENEKEIFLHVACFFKGQKTKYIENVLNSCDLATEIGLNILIERSLITVMHKTLQMHDLIQYMGMDIVRQECEDDPGRRSRLWSYDDVLRVLSYDTGDCAAKAIILEQPKLKGICIRPDTFMKMRRLKLLILRNVQNSFHGLVYVPNWLRWFQWWGAPFLLFPFGPKELVGLDMSGRSIVKMRKLFEEFQQLKYINMSFCATLVSMPDLSFTPNLELLDLSCCFELTNFPDVLKAKNLRFLYLDGCRKMDRIPDIPHKHESLEVLWLQKTASIENLIALEDLLLKDCERLESLPSTIYKLQRLQDLGLRGCTNLMWFPKYENSGDPHMKIRRPALLLPEAKFLENPSCFPFMTRLDMSYCETLVSMPDLSCAPNLLDLSLPCCKNLVEAHESIAYHDKLKFVDLGGCCELTSFPDVLKSKNLRHLILQGCTKFQKFPDIPHKHKRLEELRLGGTAIKALPASIENLICLKAITLEDCKSLVTLPPCIYKLRKLQTILLQGCSNLICFPALHWLTLENCHQLKEIPDLPPNLRILDARGCESLNKNGYKTLLHHFVRRGLIMADEHSSDEMPPRVEITFSGEEMPEWIFPAEGCSPISFTASKDLYRKFLALALCFVLCNGTEEGASVVSHVNGKSSVSPMHLYCCSYLGHIWIEYVLPHELWREDDFSEIEGGSIQFSCAVSGRRVRKWGFRILCKPLEENLKVELQDNELRDLLYEVDPEAWSSVVAAADSSTDTDLESIDSDVSSSSVGSDDSGSEIAEDETPDPTTHPLSAGEANPSRRRREEGSLWNI